MQPTPARIEPAELWAVILAGGDGTRLRPLTRRIAGDDRPKQFCAIADGDTLLDRTRRRADLLVRPDRQVVVVTRAHARYYAGLASELLPGRLVVQPGNKGTLAGIAYPLLHVQDLGGDPVVAVLPSDHHVDEDRPFMDHVRQAAALATAYPDRVVILGIEAESPETEYGWIEPRGVPVGLDGPLAFAIHRFVEKPAPAEAQALLVRGAFWNSFVMVGRAGAFLDMVRQAAPDAYRLLRGLRRAVGTRRQEAAVEAAFARMRPAGFSETVLARLPDRLLVLPVKGVGWSDWGSPRRVMASLHRSGRRPAWMGAATAG